jgi:hypothetical protein
MVHISEFVTDKYTNRDVVFFEKEGDYSHLDELHVNNVFHSKEILALIHGENVNKENNEDFSWEVTVLEKPTKDWDYFVTIDYRL